MPQSYFHKLRDDSPAQLEDFVWTIQEYIRIVLRKAIGLAVQPGAPTEMVKWDDLIFNANGR
jgi:hypothetical protein